MSVLTAWVPHEQGRALLEPLPAGVVVDVWDGGGARPDSAADVELVVLPFLASGPVLDTLGGLPALRVVQLLTAGAEAVVSRLPPGVTLCTARGAHDAATAEWVVAATLAVRRGLPDFVRAQDAGEWRSGFTDAFAGSRVLVVGYGSIGRALDRRLAGFEVEVVPVARRARPDEGVHGVEDLPALLPGADVVVVLVPVTPATRGLVDAAFLARMKDGGLLVNAARGPVVDTAALLAELRSGRLRAALDVTDPEPLPAGHPLWSAPGVLVTPHVGGSTPLAFPRAYAVVAEQLRRLAAGAPLLNVVGADGY